MHSSVPQTVDRIRLGLCIGSAFLAALPTAVLCPVAITSKIFRRFRDEDLLQRIHRMPAWARFCVRWILGIRLDVRGKEHLRRPSKGCLYICNHQSFVDIPVLAAAIGTVAFLAKREVRRYPVLGICAHAGGSVFVDRRSMVDRKRALAETIRMCQESTAVVVFPEGAISLDGSLQQRVHYSSMKRAHDVGLTVIPIGIHGTYRVLSDGMDRISRGEPVTVRIGAALNPADFEDSEEFASRCWSAVAEQHTLARAWLESRERGHWAEADAQDLGWACDAQTHKFD
jgi:1-acyl-sn-glycerol-3-phosphate acyltransferase